MTNQAFKDGDIVALKQSLENGAVGIMQLLVWPIYRLESRDLLQGGAALQIPGTKGALGMGQWRLFFGYRVAFDQQFGALYPGNVSAFGAAQLFQDQVFLGHGKLPFFLWIDFR